MKALRVFAARLRGLFAGRGSDAEFRAEMEAHLAMHVAENIRRGMTPDAARRDALLAAGGLTVAAESVRERRGLPFVEQILTDVRYAARSLRLNRGYSTAVVLTLALGIGANCAMFSIINAVVLRPLPYPDSDRILSPTLADKQQADLGIVDEWTYHDWARSARGITIAMTRGAELPFKFAEGVEKVAGSSATASYFEVLGTKPLVGRTYTAEEDRPGGPDVIVLSEQLWRRAFDADPNILGRTIAAGDRSYNVIGVMPASFTSAKRSQFWTPKRLTPSPKGTTMYFRPIARLKPGVSLQAARAELAALIKAGEANRMEPDRGRVPVMMTLQDRRFGSNKKAILLLGGAVGVLLLIACANLANLSLARVTRREREFAVRLALGASRWRLVRYVLAESLLLSAVGAAGGLLLTRASVAWFTRLSAELVGNPEGIRIDGVVLGFSLTVAVVSGLLFGLIPALTASRRSLSGALSSGTPRAVGSPRQRWIRRTLVVTQLATALVLLTGAGIVARTFWRVTSLDLGFEKDRLLFTFISLPDERYKPAAAGAFFAELEQRLRQDPAVKAVSLTVGPPPLQGVAMSWQSADSTGKGWKRIDVVAVAPTYLQMLGARLVRGRWIADSDGPTSPKVGILNETAARQLNVADPIGKQIDNRGVVAIGILKDIRQTELEGAPKPTIYIPATQVGHHLGYATLAVRAVGSAGALQNNVRRVLQSMDPALEPPSFTTMDERIADAVAPRRFTAILLSIFALLAGTLAVVGLYGVLAYLVAERTREIGIRVALGADASKVRRLVIGQGMALTAVGILIGVGISLVAVRALTSMVYQMSVYDTRSFAAGVALLSVVAWLACWIPARRASEVDPLVALRAE